MLHVAGGLHPHTEHSRAVRLSLSSEPLSLSQLLTHHQGHSTPTLLLAPLGTLGVVAPQSGLPEPTPPAKPGRGFGMAPGGDTSPRS